LAARAEKLLASQRKVLTTFAKKEVVVARALASKLGVMTERDYNELLKWGEAMKKSEGSSRGKKVGKKEAPKSKAR
jgi:hypothetical protein